jgi:acyl transferase domain-containing protein/aryl carrier-like protein
VKNNIGHLEAASGISQLTKVLLQFRYSRLVPTINSEPHNPHLQLEHTPFFVQTTAKTWPERREEQRPRRALINSFGGGGAAACLVVEEHRTERALDHATQQHCLVAFSAPDASSLDRLLVSTLAWLRTAQDDINLCDLSRTLLLGRAQFDVRLAFVASSIEEVGKRIERLRRRDDTEVFRGELIGGVKPLQVFENDEDLHAAVDAWLRKGRLERLAELWVNGVDVNWRHLPGIGLGRLVRGPQFFPFTPTRLWPESAADGREPIVQGIDVEADRVDVLERVCKAIAEMLGMDVQDIHPDRELRCYGLDSLNALRLANRLAPTNVDRAFRRKLLALKSARTWSNFLESTEK